MKTPSSGIEFCSSGQCMLIHRTKFIEYLKQIQPLNSKTGQTSDRWDAWQRSAANYSLKIEAECCCNSLHPIRSFGDIFVYTHPSIKRGNLPHPSLIHKKVPKKQKERKKRSLSETDSLNSPFTNKHLINNPNINSSRRSSTSQLPQLPNLELDFDPNWLYLPFEMHTNDNDNHNYHQLPITATAMNSTSPTSLSDNSLGLLFNNNNNSNYHHNKSPIYNTNNTNNVNNFKFNNNVGFDNDYDFNIDINDAVYQQQLNLLNNANNYSNYNFLHDDSINYFGDFNLFMNSI